MLRTVLAVVLAVVIVGIVAPALEDARVTRGESRTEIELARVETAVTELAQEENVGARRSLKLRFPAETVTRAPVAFVAVGGVPNQRTAADTDRSDVLAYRVSGGDMSVVRLPVDLLVLNDGNSASDDHALVVRGGTTRLTLRLLRDGDRPVVAVRRFKTGDGTNPPHVSAVALPRPIADLHVRPRIRGRPPVNRRDRLPDQRRPRGLG